ncbi:MAG: response regulator [Campylobacterota bacterium]|nr:response regulator [Campylobacterota bacterium]
MDKLTIQEIVSELKDLNILIVEDGIDVRKIMETTFNKLVHSTTIAIDGKDGLDKFTHEKPDIIITDIRMPNMSGNDMIDKIKEIDNSVPIIVVSGHERLINKNNKADVILNKPIKFEQLISHIYNLTKK